jgi:hypothetical protein
MPKENKKGLFKTRTAADPQETLDKTAGTIYMMVIYTGPYLKMKKSMRKKPL